jgi:S-adenosylmethionine-diacylglycerol 3-amino-3-carboxypropyl transferase
MKWSNITWNIPNILSMYRLLSTPFLAWVIFQGYEEIFAIWFFINLLTDIADGYIARRYQLQTEEGAKLDSMADMLSYVIALYGIVSFHSYLLTDSILFWVYIGIFVIAAVLPMIKYKNSVGGLHLWSAKIGGYVQGIFFCFLFLIGYTPWLFYAAMAIGIWTELEAIIIHLLSPTPLTNAKSLFHFLKGRKEDIDFSILRYANCWEDAYLLEQALQPTAGSRVLSIASAGDNSFAMLIHDDVQVMAADISDKQIQLCKIKQAAIKELELDEFKQFLGLEKCNDRNALIQRINNSCNAEVKQYIADMSHDLLKGIAHTGRFERYFEYFRKYLLPLVHSQKMVLRLLQDKSESEQKEFYFKHWNNWQWRLLMKIFFSKQVMGRKGRSMAMLASVKVNVGDYIMDKANKHLQSTDCQHNPILEMIFTGKYKKNVPLYLVPENYHKIKRNIDNIYFYEGFVQHASLIDSQGYTHANLSNIFEYMDEEIFNQVAQELKTVMAKGSKLAYWNLMVHRDLEDLGYQPCDVPHNKDDDGFFYRAFLMSKL